MNEKNNNIHSKFWSNIFSIPAGNKDLSPLNNGHKEFLRSIPIFKDLTKRDLSSLMPIIHNRSYLAGEYIFSQDDPGIGIYFILSGEVVIRRNIISNQTDGSIKTIQLAVFQEGDFFGEIALIDGEKRSASAVAKTDVNLVVIFKPDLDEYIDMYPKRGIKILDKISKIVVTRLRIINEENLLLHTKLQNKTGE